MHDRRGLINVHAFIFEHNRCVGAVRGSRLYLKYAHHLYQAHNTELVTWGGDREGMKHDNPGRSFAGRIHAMSMSTSMTLPTTNSDFGSGFGCVITLTMADEEDAFAR